MRYRQGWRKAHGIPDRAGDDAVGQTMFEADLASMTGRFKPCARLLVCHEFNGTQQPTAPHLANNWVDSQLSQPELKIGSSISRHLGNDSLLIQQPDILEGNGCRDWMA